MYAVFVGFPQRITLGNFVSSLKVKSIHTNDMLVHGSESVNCCFACASVHVLHMHETSWTCFMQLDWVERGWSVGACLQHDAHF